MDVDRLIGWNLRRLRRKLRLSQIDAAAQIANSDQSSLSLIERGLRTINVVTLYKIGRGLNVDIGELFNLKGVPKTITGDLDVLVSLERPSRQNNKTNNS
ncbi:helix-turn-helix domain-containing protein [Asticcacaulis sp.]|uniref:helix-turn-helix domain-containing protein n=1 Tax=Asticcacaulis sp. TaxID=1872648 RepID=UPI0039C86D71